MTCPHIDRTLVTTRGLGSWDVVEVYACDACGTRIEVPVEIEDPDDDED